MDREMPYRFKYMPKFLEFSLMRSFDTISKFPKFASFLSFIGIINPDKVDKDTGYTLAHLAAANLNSNVMKWATENQKELNLPNKNGNTPLHLFVEAPLNTVVDITNFNSCGQSLKSRLSDNDYLAINGNSQSLIHIAVLSRNISKLNFLGTKCDSLINTPDENGNTPLHYTLPTNEKNQGVVEFLFKKGADETIKDKKGESPQDLAESYDSKMFLDILDSHKRNNLKKPDYSIPPPKAKKNYTEKVQAESSNKKNAGLNTAR